MPVFSNIFAIKHFQTYFMAALFSAIWVSVSHASVESRIYKDIPSRPTSASPVEKLVGYCSYTATTVAGLRVHYQSGSTQVISKEWLERPQVAERVEAAVRGDEKLRPWIEMLETAECSSRAEDYIVASGSRLFEAAREEAKRNAEKIGKSPIIVTLREFSSNEMSHCENMLLRRQNLASEIKLFCENEEMGR